MSYDCCPLYTQRVRGWSDLATSIGRKQTRLQLSKLALVIRMSFSKILNRKDFSRRYSLQVYRTLIKTKGKAAFLRGKKDVARGAASKVGRLLDQVERDRGLHRE